MTDTAKQTPIVDNRRSPLLVFSGQSNRPLAQSICDNLGIPLGKSSTEKFTNDNLIVRYEESLREGDIFIVQTFSTPVSDSIMELLMMIDAAKSASAGRVTAVIPYYSYARSDKKDSPRISIAGRLVADLLQEAGADRVLTMTLHAPQVHGFFKVPVDHLSADSVLAQHFRSCVDDASQGVVLAPDAGSIKRAAGIAHRLDAGLAMVDKQRISDTEVSPRAMIGDVEGKTVFIVDDEISTAGSLIETVDIARKMGARDVYVGVTHGVYTGPAIERIAALGVTQVASTNTVLVSEEKIAQADGKLAVLDVAPHFANAIRNIHTGESVSTLFN
ncbi:ribose-phosphate diphosphokinase [Deinococcus radiophilus]|uniref:ribose-phosphate diphosphokinase n=1 Tax=Deinococcus radiophilus TaxID=32062 RepID=A0A3S0I7T0_9DEIO|nr:ribose-phosphate pyrophosphokinase [Deinococcus radiophilus]RTR29395.1 ribose-phosphate pyrophosphokinase [Deinococcus radiophilus]UFA50778.1 ribose-phosphate pyrophosphokinase [Deinococcus radiophilus]